MEKIKIPNIKLSNGVELPILGLGTWNLHGENLKNAIEAAHSCGYRLLDTADTYGNESEIGLALKELEISKNETLSDSEPISNLNDLNQYNQFSPIIASKVHIPTHRGRYKLFPFLRKKVKDTFIKSRILLQKDVLDLYFLHHCNKGYIHNFQKICNIYKMGGVRAVGICNCDLEHLKLLIDKTDFIPHVCQFQIHPYYTKKKLIEYCQSKGIVCQAHTQFALGCKELLEEPVLKRIALNHGVTVHQIILRWLIQQNIMVIPRSHSAKHIKSNAQIFDFIIENHEMEQIDGLNRDLSFKDYDKPT